MRIARRIKRVLRPRLRQQQGTHRTARGKEPPEIPPGWKLGPPDFIGIGVQKAGTTWWWKLILEHPDVVGYNKETHQLTRFGWRPVFERDIEAYERHFPRPDGAMAGEWTPRYMAVAGVSETMKAVAPNAKILVLLRDPVERYRSGVGQWQKHKERQGMRLNLWAGRKDAYARSFYGFTLAPYFEAFGPQQILVLQLERCQRIRPRNTNAPLSSWGCPSGCLMRRYSANRSTSARSDPHPRCLMNRSTWSNPWKATSSS